MSQTDVQQRERQQQGQGGMAGETTGMMMGSAGGGMVGYSLGMTSGMMVGFIAGMLTGLSIARSSIMAGRARARR